MRCFTQCLARVQKGIAAGVYRAMPQSVFVKACFYRMLWMLPERFRESSPVREALKALDARLTGVRFVNIGANDGLAGDPLREFIVTRGWTGILVEPVPFVFQRLAAAYRGLPRARVENAAIAEKNGTMEFWYIRKNTVLSPGYDQLGSFDPAQVLKHEAALPRLREFLDHIQVPALTVESLLGKHGFDGVDVLLIDTEGYDGTILAGLDLKRLTPRLIIYENVNMPAEENRRSEDLLRRAGYRISFDGPNTLAEKEEGRP